MYDHLKKLISQSTRVSVLTGAGISTDSGIPDYRGPDGVWTKNPELEGLMTYGNYCSSPDVRHTYWDRGGFDLKINNASPNEGHLALAELYNNGPVRKVITQNVDGLHQKSGIDDENVIEAHGSVQTSSCISCGTKVKTQDILDSITDESTINDAIACWSCGGIIKQDVIMFGEQLNPQVYADACAAVSASSLLLVIGTSLQVSPINELLDVCHAYGGIFVIINRDPTVYDKYAELVINESITDVLTEAIS